MLQVRAPCARLHRLGILQAQMHYHINDHDRDDEMYTLRAGWLGRPTCSNVRTNHTYQP